MNRKLKKNIMTMKKKTNKDFRQLDREQKKGKKSFRLRQQETVEQTNEIKVYAYRKI